MGQAVAFGEEVWAGHGEHRFMQARRQIRRLVDTFGAWGSGRHGGLPLRMVVPRRIGGNFDRSGGVFRYSCFTLQRYEKKLKLPNYKRKNYPKNCTFGSILLGIRQLQTTILKIQCTKAFRDILRTIEQVGFGTDGRWQLIRRGGMMGYSLHFLLKTISNNFYYYIYNLLYI